jgi:hypothetical protein
VVKKRREGYNGQFTTQIHEKKLIKKRKYTQWSCTCSKSQFYEIVTDGKIPKCDVWSPIIAIFSDTTG